MKTLCLSGLFHSKEHKSLFPSLFIRIYHFSTVSGSASYPNFPRRQEEDSRNVRVSVWWDFENCNIPVGVNEFKVTQTITAAIRANGMMGPIQINAFGDVSQLSKPRHKALISTGVLINHVPRGGKNSADMSLLVGLLYWTSNNPPPAHLFLISGDRDFAGILHKLRMVNYNILLAGHSAPAVLCSAASIVWHWVSLVKGEDVNGKHYNQPPDGPYSSWYGHYKRPLEDPFAVDQQQPPLSDAKDESCLQSNATLIPKTVFRQVQCILHSHPKGISISDLGKKLSFLPKGYYGYKKITHFVAAMPHIGKMQFQGDGQYLVVPVRAKRPSKDNMGRVKDDNDGLKVEVAENSVSDAEIEKNTLSESFQQSIRNEKPERELDKRMDEEKVWKSNKLNADVDSLESLADESTSKEQTSLFQRVVKSCKFWRTSDEPKLSNDQSNKTINEQIEIEKNTLSESFQQSIRNEKPECELDKRMDEEKVWKSNNPNADVDSLESLADESASKEQTSLFQRVVKSCKFWRTSDEPKLSSDQSNKTINEQIRNSSPGNEIFSEDKFRSDMKYYLDSPRGSIVGCSTTRASMAQNLQKKDPAALKSLSQTEPLHLVNLLIDKKKLVEENPSDALPFKLVKPHSSKGLRATTSDNEHVTERNHCNIPYSEVSSPPVKATGVSTRPKYQISKDCKEFVKDVLRKNPNGYELANFRKDFENKYGYMINLQILGHKTLSKYLLTLKIPGVALDLGFIVPSSSTAQVSLKLDRDASLSKSDDDFESAWDELGPVSSSSNPKDRAEVYLSSDSEDESCKGRDAKQREVSNKEDTSLLQILDLCHGKKEESGRSPKAKKDGKMMTEDESKDKLIHEILDCMKKMDNAKME